MAQEIILLDTSVLIDYFRKKDKSKTYLFKLANTYNFFAISSITEFEIYTGSNDLQIAYWDNFFKEIVIFPFDTETSRIAALLNKALKEKRKSLDIPDLFIAATAIKNSLVIATLNTKHFSKLEELKILFPGKE